MMKEEASVWRFYLQDEFTILENLRLNAGLRYDHYETFEGAVSLGLCQSTIPWKERR